MKGTTMQKPHKILLGLTRGQVDALLRCAVVGQAAMREERTTKIKHSEASLVGGAIARIRRAQAWAKEKQNESR